MAVLRFAFFMVLCGLGHTASVGGKSDYDTIVIGLGAAGTAAASTLAQAGKKVLALEAQDRIGGRVHTVPCGDDGAIELGSEWIQGSEGSPIYKLATDNNVAIQQQEPTMEVFWSNGQLADIDVINDLSTVALNAAGEAPEKPESVGSHVTKKILARIAEKYPSLQNDQEFKQGFLDLAEKMLSSYDGADSWNDVTTLSHYEVLGGSQELSWGKSGYKTLFDILLNKYNNGPGLPNLTVKLNTEVTQVVWPQEPTSKVVVKTKDGAEYTADNVIVTVSVGVLKDRLSSLFSPALPAKKVAAIENIPVGVVNKVVFTFSEPWWGRGKYISFLWKDADKALVPEEDKWLINLGGVSSPFGCENALTLWTTGKTARDIEAVSDEKLKTYVLELLRGFLGPNRPVPEPTAMLRTNWFSNPFTRGSYSYNGLNAPQHPTAREDLAEPLTDSSGKPRVLFAGEASHPTQYSTVHGAVASGKREASRLL